MPLNPPANDALGIILDDDDDDNKTDHIASLQSTARTIWISPPHEGIARDFHALTQQEQFDIWNDLTGNPQQTLNPTLFMNESRDMLHRAQLQLSNEIQKINAANSDDCKANPTALNLVLTHHPEFVGNLDFRLKFLRAEKFNIGNAARRIATHFEVKLELWGLERLGREIFLSDLDDDDLYSLNHGAFQILPKTDQHGRKVLFYYKTLANCYRSRANILRAVWYLSNRLSDEEAVQKLGVVNVAYNNGGIPPEGIDFETFRQLAQLFQGLPLRFTSFYVCLDSSPWLAVVEAFSTMVGQYVRLRMRTLQGSHLECFYQLMALGIPYDTIPVTSSGDLLRKDHIHFMQDVRKDDDRLQKIWAQQVLASNIRQNVLNRMSKGSQTMYHGDPYMDSDCLSALISAAAPLYGRQPHSISDDKRPDTEYTRLVG